MSAEIIYRDATIDDVNFILSSWLKSYRPSAPLVSDEVYFREHKALVMQLIQRSAVHIACDPSYPLSIYGYAVVEQGAVHYVYVKFALRKFGVARALLKRAGVESPFAVSHLSETGLRILRAHPGAFIYNPYKVSKP
jgi:hypothetical protein